MYVTYIHNSFFKSPNILFYLSGETKNWKSKDDIVDITYAKGTL